MACSSCICKNKKKSKESDKSSVLNTGKTWQSLSIAHQDCIQRKFYTKMKKMASTLCLLIGSLVVHRNRGKFGGDPNPITCLTSLFLFINQYFHWKGTQWLKSSILWVSQDSSTMSYNSLDEANLKPPIWSVLNGSPTLSYNYQDAADLYAWENPLLVWWAN